MSVDIWRHKFLAKTTNEKLLDIHGTWNMFTTNIGDFYWRYCMKYNEAKLLSGDSNTLHNSLITRNSCSIE
jgi:hypothetical protein